MKFQTVHSPSSRSGRARNCYRWERRQEPLFRCGGRIVISLPFSSCPDHTHIYGQYPSMAMFASAAGATYRVSLSLSANRRYVECERICKFVQNKFCLYRPKTLASSILTNNTPSISSPLPRVSCRMLCYVGPRNRYPKQRCLFCICVSLLFRGRTSFGGQEDCIQMNHQRLGLTVYTPLR